MTQPFRKYERKPFDAEGCTKCGRCLSECPVMQLPEPRAKAGIASLIECLEDPNGPDSAAETLLGACTSCFACNLICPEDCRPANLFLDLWQRQFQRNGLPERARYFLPHSRPNFRTYVLDRLPRDERAAVESWQRIEPAETLFFPGCNLITTPYLTFSRLFAGLPIRGSLEYCCGEMYFRMGLYDQVEQTARKCTDYFRTLGAKTVYLQCTAGLNMFSNVLPQFGADFSGIRFVPFLERISAQLDSGELTVVHRFDGQTVTLQDSCHAKIYEPNYHEWPRKLLTRLGFEIREAPQHAQTALCCGIGCGFSHQAAYGKAALIRGQRACAHNLRRGGADCVAVYCSGCLEMLSVSRYVSRMGRPVYHILELIQQAIGETPLRRHRRVARDFLVGTLRNQGRGGNRFTPEPIE
jgi:Fe-S oxidoreductase